MHRTYTTACRCLSLVALPAMCLAAGGETRDSARRILPPNQTRQELMAYLEPRGSHFATPPDTAAWDVAARRLRTRFLTEVFLRGVPAAWTSNDLKTVWLDASIRGEGYSIRKLRYEVVPGLWVGGLLYEPHSLNGKVPAVLNLSGHEIEGAAIPFKQTICANLAKRGMIALNLEWFGTGQLLEPRYRHWNQGCLDLCGCAGSSVFYLAVKRGLDVLLAHPAADPDRVAATGLSGGGWQTLLIAALDPRVKVAVPNAGYIGFAERKKYAEDTGDLEQNPVDLLNVGDYAHLTALLAPRPALLIYNDRDDCCYQAGRARASVFDPVVPLYRLYGLSDRFAFHVNHDPGTHNYERENREALYRFLNRQFLPESQWNDAEIPIGREILGSRELAIAYPPDNRDYQGLALELMQSLPRHPCPTGDRTAIEAWQQRVRPLLRDRIRPERYRSARVEPVGDARAPAVEGASVRVCRLRIDEKWTLPLLEYTLDGRAPSSSPSELRRGGTTIVLCDGALGETASVVSEWASPGARVLVANILFTGECEADVELPVDRVVHSARWIYAQLLNSSGSRPLGIQVGQICALLEWAQDAHRDEPTQLLAQGRVSSLAALAVVALNPGRVDRACIRGLRGRWKELLEQGVSYPDAPSLFCFGLAELVDVNDLVRLAAPTTVDVIDEPLRR